MANERLRSSISAGGHTFEAVATAVKVDPKTVERWITTGRMPHRNKRWATAKFLDKDETYLWPELANDVRIQRASEAEFVQLYPNRGGISNEFWRQLFEQATNGIDILVYSGLFLTDTNPEFPDMLINKARSGVKVRLLLGDPDSENVLAKGIEEGIDEGLPSRVRISLNYLSKALKTPGVSLRTHSTPLYNSIYRSDNAMLVNAHAYGFGAGFNPVFHLQRVVGGRMFQHYEESFEKVWETAVAYPKGD